MTVPLVDVRIGAVGTYRGIVHARHIVPAAAAGTAKKEHLGTIAAIVVGLENGICISRVRAADRATDVDRQGSIMYIGNYPPLLNFDANTYIS